MTFICESSKRTVGVDLTIRSPGAKYIACDFEELDVLYMGIPTKTVLQYNR